MYHVPETNLFADGPIIPKERELLAIRQRNSRNGYTTPALPSHTNSSLPFNNNPRRTSNHSNGHRRPNSGSSIGTREAQEIRRMKQNYFMEAKNIMYVFDEILQNAMEKKDLDSKFYKMTSLCNSEIN